MSVTIPRRQAPAGLKVAGAIGLIVVITLTPAAQPVWFMAETVVLLAALLLGRVSIPTVLRRLLLLSPFIAGTALAAAIGAHGVDWRIIALRSGLCITTAIVLAQTTSFSEVLGVFRAARVPALLITTLALMHRYLFVLADESARMSRARAARTFTGRRRLVWLGAASVVGRLFVRASERAERVYDAMCARGWRA